MKDTHYADFFSLLLFHASSTLRNSQSENTECDMHLLVLLYTVIIHLNIKVN
jgi:hypothetical protein